MRIVLFTKLLTVGRFVDLVLELADRGAEIVVASPASERERPVPEGLVAAPRVRMERYEEFEDEDCAILAARCTEFCRGEPGTQRGGS